MVTIQHTEGVVVSYYHRIVVNKLIKFKSAHMLPYTYLLSKWRRSVYWCGVITKSIILDWTVHYANTKSGPSKIKSSYEIFGILFTLYFFNFEWTFFLTNLKLAYQGTVELWAFSWLSQLNENLITKHCWSWMTLSQFSSFYWSNFTTELCERTFVLSIYLKNFYLRHKQA